jgi:MFS family permease
MPAGAEPVRPAGARAGLQTALDIAIAPRAACAALREAPTWGWAFAIAALLGMIATLAMNPIWLHVLERELPARFAATGQIAQMPADARNALIAQQLGLAKTLTGFSFLLIPFVLAGGCALQALVMLAANALAGGDGTFKKFWALAVNAAVVGTGIASVALLAIALLRGPDAFPSSAAVANAVPGLGTFVSPEAKPAAAFLSAINVFAVWDSVLLATGMIIVARLPRGSAIAAALVILAGTGVFPLAGAALQNGLK